MGGRKWRFVSSPIMKTNADSNPPPSDTKFTLSKATAYADLEFFHEMHRRGIHQIGGISTRPSPLIIARSGAGKTFLINKLAAQNNLPAFGVNVQNWIVRGAKADIPATLGQIADFVRSNEAGIIFLDEVNKLTSEHASSSAWTADVFSEIIAFLDGDGRLDAMGFDGIREHLRTRFFVAGAAAFQAEWKTRSVAPKIGFQSDGQVDLTTSSVRYERAVRAQNNVPDELVFRFNDKLIVLEPPTADEFAARILDIRSRLTLPPLSDHRLGESVNEALSSGKMMRWLEGYASTCLREIADGLTRGSKLPENCSATTAPRTAASSSASGIQKTNGVESKRRSMIE